ncbi:MAG TPA: adenosine-specific kinase [Dictyoglomaceae bacterium]|nr:adenosine-specific kinase [Dictyoglomaceae bacterium]HOL39506.1 adenosine-specific kinase [Dictyoglomaceae bacterium]HPP16115.1 adenosine-specific kinase [Dictyoglomaceae bacterium]
MELHIIDIEKPEEVNLILGQTHFIKTVEDLYEAIVNTVPGAKFGIAFCEASGPALIRHIGTDSELEDLAVRNLQKIGAGHSFLIFLGNLYPINILNAIKNVPEVVNIYAATSNALKVIVVEDADGRGILGVIDGVKPKGVEGEEDIKRRKEFLRRIGYKL